MSTIALRAGPLKALLRSNAARYKSVMQRDSATMNKEGIENLLSLYASAMREVPNIDKSSLYPIYPDPISVFMRTLQLEPWVATDYQPVNTRKILESIDTASIQDVKRALTGAARSERFGDGMWAKILEEKMLDPVIKRLQELCDA